MRKKALLAVAVSAAALTVTAPPSNAETVKTCTAVGTAKISPRITLTPATHTIALNYTYVCVYTGTTINTVTTGNTAFSVTWTGSCLHSASNQPDEFGNSVLGVSAVLRLGAAPPGARGGVLIPTDSLGNPCDMGQALFTNSGPDILP